MIRHGYNPNSVEDGDEYVLIGGSGPSLFTLRPVSVYHASEALSAWIPRVNVLPTGKSDQSKRIYSPDDLVVVRTKNRLKYQRGRIELQLDSTNYQVELIDVQQSIHVHEDNLRPLRGCFSHIGRLPVIIGCLFNAIPKNEIEWSDEANEFFMDFVGKKIVKINYRGKNIVNKLNMYEIIVDGRSVIQDLTKKGFTATWISLYQSKPKLPGESIYFSILDKGWPPKEKGDKCLNNSPVNDTVVKERADKENHQQVDDNESQEDCALSIKSTSIVSMNNSSYYKRNNQERSPKCDLTTGQYENSEKLMTNGQMNINCNNQKSLSEIDKSIMNEQKNIENLSKASTSNLNQIIVPSKKIPTSNSFSSFAHRQEEDEESISQYEFDDIEVNDEVLEEIPKATVDKYFKVYTLNEEKDWEDLNTKENIPYSNQNNNNHDQSSRLDYSIIKDHSKLVETSHILPIVDPDDGIPIQQNLSGIRRPLLVTHDQRPIQKLKKRVSFRLDESVPDEKEPSPKKPDEMMHVESLIRSGPNDINLRMTCTDSSDKLLREKLDDESTKPVEIDVQHVWNNFDGLSLDDKEPFAEENIDEHGNKLDIVQGSIKLENNLEKLNNLNEQLPTYQRWSESLNEKISDLNESVPVKLEKVENVLEKFMGDTSLNEADVDEIELLEIAQNNLPVMIKLDVYYEMYPVEYVDFSTMYVQFDFHTNLLNKINEIITREEKNCKPVELHYGLYCLALYPGDKLFYRCFIKNVNLRYGVATVFFLDYGNVARLSVVKENFVELPKELERIQPIAYKVQIVDVKLKEFKKKDKFIDIMKKLTANGDISFKAKFLTMSNEEPFYITMPDEAAKLLVNE
ncbi:hypothetical protein SNEBB_000815 [Seison nebaliae]|nr:hypothetical protein SNEBB_000815 [Seison nebaliae]